MITLYFILFVLAFVKANYLVPSGISTVPDGIRSHFSLIDLTRHTGKFNFSVDNYELFAGNYTFSGLHHIVEFNPFQRLNLLRCDYDHGIVMPFNVTHTPLVQLASSLHADLLLHNQSSTVDCGPGCHDLFYEDVDVPEQYFVLDNLFFGFCTLSVSNFTQFGEHYYLRPPQLPCVEDSNLLVNYTGITTSNFTISSNPCACSVEGFCHNLTYSYCPTPEFDHENITYLDFEVGLIYNHGPSNITCVTTSPPGEHIVLVGHYRTFINVLDTTCSVDGAALVSHTVMSYVAGINEVYHWASCSGVQYSFEQPLTVRFGEYGTDPEVTGHTAFEAIGSLKGYIDQAKLSTCSFSSTLVSCSATLCSVNVSTSCDVYFVAKGYSSSCEGESFCMLSVSRKTKAYNGPIDVTWTGEHKALMGPMIPEVDLASSDCIPFCGIPWFQDLSLGWRIFFAILFLVLLYAFLGYLIVKITQLKAAMTAPLEGWKSLFLSIYRVIRGIFVAIWTFFAFILCCKRKSKVHASDEENPFAEEEDSTPLRPIERKTRASRPFKATGTRFSTVTLFFTFCLVSTVIGSGRLDLHVGHLHPYQNWKNPALNIPYTNHSTDYPGIPGCISTALVYNVTSSFVEFEMSSNRGSTVCLSITHIVKGGRNITLDAPLRLDITADGALTLIGSRTYPDVGTPDLLMTQDCECPTGGNHYCDFAHKSDLCLSSNCWFYTAQGSKEGCNIFLIGHGHYCLAISVGSSKLVCHQYPIRPKETHVSLRISLLNTTKTLFLASDSLTYQHVDSDITMRIFPFTTPTFSASILSGTIFDCGIPLIWMDRGEVISGLYGSTSDPSFFQFDNTSWSTDMTTLRSKIDMFTDACSTSTSYTVDIFDFNAASKSQKFMASVHFASIGNVRVNVSNAILEWSKDLPIRGNVAVTHGRIDFLLASPLCKFVSAKGTGEALDTSSGVVITVNCDGPGRQNFILNDVLTVRQVEEGTHEYFLLLPFNETTELINITLCNLLEDSCTSQTTTVTVAAQDTHKFTTPAGAEDFFEGENLGAYMRPSEWGFTGGFSLPLWADILIFIGLLIILGIIGVCVARCAKQKIL